MLQHMTRSLGGASQRDDSPKELLKEFVLDVDSLSADPWIDLVLSGHGDSCSINGRISNSWNATTLLHAKAGYLSPAFWSVRANVLPSSVWVIISIVVLQMVHEPGSVTAMLQWTHKMQQWAPLCMVLLMRSPKAYAVNRLDDDPCSPSGSAPCIQSTSGHATMCGFFSLIILLARYLQRHGSHLKQSITDRSLS